jgi:ATP-dependent helicase HrpA
MALEQVSLYGLIIVEKRRISFAAIDPPEARRIFILEALVRGALDTRAAFKSHNERVRAEVERLEHKRRRRDVLADEQTQFEFFDARIPAEVNSARSFEKWLSGLGSEGKALLFLGHDVLMRDNAGAAPHDLFPDRLEIAGRLFSLDYHFAPGNPDDGVHITVPLELLNTLMEGKLQWLVPGLLRDKLIALIRQLPKPVRRALTPVPAFADALLDSMQGRGDESMLKVCAGELQRISGLQVEVEDLKESAISDHFRFLIRIVDANGELLDSGRDLAAIQERLGHKAQRSFMDQQGGAFNRDGATGWTFGTLSPGVRTADGAMAWPALVDQETAVGLRLFDTWDEAALSHIEGVMRLLTLAISDRLTYLKKHHGLSREALLAWSPRESSAELIESLMRRSLVDCAGDVSTTRDMDSFDTLCRRVRNEIGNGTLERAELLNGILPLYAALSVRIHGDLEVRRPEVSDDISSQLEDLLYPGFLIDLEPGRLEHYPRYLKAIEERLAQLENNPVRDGQRMALIEPWWGRYREALDKGCVYDSSMDAFRWLLEEYRVSLFAQRLGTAGRVSEKRLLDAWKRTGC